MSLANPQATNSAMLSAQDFLVLIKLLLRIKKKPAARNSRPEVHTKRLRDWQRKRSIERHAGDVFIQSRDGSRARAAVCTCSHLELNIDARSKRERQIANIDRLPGSCRYNLSEPGSGERNGSREHRGRTASESPTPATSTARTRTTRTSRRPAAVKDS